MSCWLVSPQVFYFILESIYILFDSFNFGPKLTLIVNIFRLMKKLTIYICMYCRIHIRMYLEKSKNYIGLGTKYFRTQITYNKTLLSLFHQKAFDFRFFSLTY